jgi:hypothetical protein
VANASSMLVRLITFPSMEIFTSKGALKTTVALLESIAPCLGAGRGFACCGSWDFAGALGAYIGIATAAEP